MVELLVDRRHKNFGQTAWEEMPGHPVVIIKIRTVINICDFPAVFNRDFTFVFPIRHGCTQDFHF